MPKETANSAVTSTACKVCGGFKFTHEEYCKECTLYKENVEYHKRMRYRRNYFGYW